MVNRVKGKSCHILTDKIRVSVLSVCCPALINLPAQNNADFVFGLQKRTDRLELILGFEIVVGIPDTPEKRPMLILQFKLAAVAISIAGIIDNDIGLCVRCKCF